MTLDVEKRALPSLLKPGMGKIPETSDHYRTKEQMVADVVLALKSKMSFAGKHSVLRTVCWHWTEINGKYKGCEWWTKAAMELFDDDSKTRLLRHEHAVPKSIVIGMLFTLKPVTAEAVRAMFDQFLVGVVVTTKEDTVLNLFRNTMPPEFFDQTCPEYHDPMLRYKQCGLQVVQRCW